MAMEKKIDYSCITPQVQALGQLCARNSTIDTTLYETYSVNRGLRDINGNGVLTGLTKISDIVAFHIENGKKLPCEGELYYRGINVQSLVDGFMKEKRFGYEETVYLLLFGQLPTTEQLKDFQEQLAYYRALPTNFVRDIIMRILLLMDFHIPM